LIAAPGEVVARGAGPCRACAASDARSRSMLRGRSRRTTMVWRGA
jgi:hypothetical protein